MDESLFYIAGGALIAVALILSLVGMRSDRFPSGNVLAAGLIVVFLLVAATAVGAVELAQHEAGERLAEANEAADQTAAAEDVAGQDAGDTGEPAPAAGNDGQGSPGGEGESSGSAEEGGKLFVATGCGSCHTIASLGSDAQGTIGPNLDTVLAGKDDAFIEESIVKPSASVTEGFPDGTMPANYGTELSQPQIDALVAFLSQSAGS